MERKIRLILLRGAFDKWDAMALKTKAKKLLRKSASPSPRPSSVPRSSPEARAGAGAGSVLVWGNSGKKGENVLGAQRDAGVGITEVSYPAGE